MRNRVKKVSLEDHREKKNLLCLKVSTHSLFQLRFEKIKD